MGATILIVDDSRMVRMMMRGALEQDGHRVVEAADGRQALDLFPGAAPDLVITDINMPDMDGLTLIRALRQLPGHELTPILVVTTESGDAMIQQGREAGATGWIVKPFRTEQLREMALRALELRARALSKLRSGTQ